MSILAWGGQNNTLRQNGNSFFPRNFHRKCNVHDFTTNAIKAAVFLDAGSLGRSTGFGKMRYSVGAGLRYDLPIGPVRLDYGWNPAPQEHESSGAVHFTLGFAF